jgi:hypothetical protein
MLFTDVANPTSNKIYAAVGYRRTGDWEEIELDRNHPSHARRLRGRAASAPPTH